MKVAIVYTSTTPELITMVNSEIKKNLGENIEIQNYEDASILDEVRKEGYVTGKAAARLVEMFMQATKAGADIILNCCSSVGEVVDAAADLGKYTGVPIIRIDEEMCKEAVRLGDRIGVLATLPTTLIPTKNTLLRVARELNKHIEIIDGLIEGAFGIDQEQFRQRMKEKTTEIIDQCDVVLLCQGSMAYVEEYLHKEFKKTVVSSPRFGAKEVKKGLIQKGIIKE